MCVYEYMNGTVLGSWDKLVILIHTFILQSKPMRWVLLLTHVIDKNT